MNARIVSFGLFVLCLGCSSSSGPGGDPIVLTTDSSVYTYTGQEVKIVVSLANYSNYPLYCIFARGKAILFLEEKNDTSWFMTGSFPIQDISQDSIYMGMIPKNSTYKDTLILVFSSPGSFRISWSGYTTPQGRGSLSEVSNVFKISQ